MADFVILCCECGHELTKSPEGWTGGDWPDYSGPMVVWHPGTDCPSGNEPGDRHVPDVDLPDSLDPEEVEAWLART
jgi:hypothetical protein